MKSQPKKIKELSEMQKSSQVKWENQPTWFLKKEQENGWIQLDFFVISRSIKYQVEIKTIDKLIILRSCKKLEHTIAALKLWGNWRCQNEKKNMVWQSQKYLKVVALTKFYIIFKINLLGTYLRPHNFIIGDIRL